MGLALFAAFAACKSKEEPPPPSFDASALLAAASANTPAAMEKGAREEFATKFKCPAEQVTAKRRADVDPATSAGGHELFDLEGCNHTLLLDCRPHHANGAVYPDWADCSDVKPAHDGGR
ncbi:MAG TPA: hypothetical protein VIF62_11440 [Labilithrix sp.]